MLASSFFDPVLGVDIHYEMVPTPAPVPTPIPNPFVGIVFDPVGLAAGIALGAAIGAVTGAPFQGPVLYWTAFPATNTGTEAIHVPGHILIPPGVAWAPFPKTPKPVIHPGETPEPALPIKPEDDAVVVFGSKTVLAMGSNAVRLGDIAMSCSEPLRLPSSVVLAVPKGAPILIGGPPSLDVMAAVMASLRTRFVSDSLHALVSRLKPSRFRNLLHRGVCFFTGHPVDVASGKVMTEFVDLEFPGEIPIHVERIYSSAFAARPGPLGYGWSWSLDQAVWRERGKVVLLAEDGREIEFDTFDLDQHRIEPGQSVYNPIERLTLHCDSEGWRVVDEDGDVREFGQVAGRRDGRAMLLRMRTRCGCETAEFHYDERGRLSWVRDAGGRTLGIGHDDHDRVVELHRPQPDGAGHVLHRRFVYDEVGDLVEVVDALGKSWRFVYVTHLLTQETDRNGLSFYFIYDGLGEDAWCVRTWGDGGIHDHVLSYDKKNHRTLVTNSLGEVAQYHMNVAGQVVKEVDPHGAESLYEYDPRTLALVAQTDPLGHETRLSYDERGNCTRVDFPDGSSMEQRFHPDFNEPIDLRDPNGGQWLWEYDTQGRVTGHRDPGGAVTLYRYDGARPREVIGPTGVSLELRYDSAGNLAEFDTLGGGTMRLEHDALGRLVGAEGPSSARASWVYDAEDQLILKREPDETTRRYAYGAEGELVQELGARRDRRYVYTGYYWPQIEAEAGLEAAIEYDTEGKILALVNEKGERYEVEYDSTGQVICERDFDGATRRFVRDLAGRPTTITEASGRATQLSHDSMGRMTRSDYSDGSFRAFNYRADGAIVSAENTNARIEFEVDALGRVTRETTSLRDGRERDVASRYDLGGHRIEVASSEDHTHRCYFEPPGQLRAVEVPSASWHVSFQRDSSGQELARSYSNGALVQWTRDVAGRPTARQIASSGGRARVRTFYEWQPDARLAQSHDEVSGMTRYTHDQLGRLTGEQGGDGRAQTRIADEVGNIYRRPDGSDRDYSPGGRLLRDEQERYEYDADGNLTRMEGACDESLELKWSEAGLLKEVEFSDGRRVCFEYDALDRRIKKTIYSPEAAEPREEVEWLWDGDNPLIETSTSTGRRVWVFDGEHFNVLARLEAGRHWSAAPDLNGVASEWFDERGELVSRTRLDLFGHLELLEGSELSPFRWPGQYEDRETGLVYNRFRYYSPSQGRFISKDPLGPSAGFNPWAYVDDPLVSFDPLGLVERFFRFVSEVEARQSATNLGGDGQLHRRPHGQSLGRGPKWITKEGAEPRLGKGTRPEWRLDIMADDGTLAWLERNGIDFDLVDGEAGAPNKALIKANEPGSFGVGIGLLDEFNRRVNGRTTATRGGGAGGGKKKRKKRRGKRKKCR